jgi:DNA-binding FadR family transcriptional regulator
MSAESLPSSIVRALEARDPEWAASVMLSHVHAARGALNR